MDAIKLKDEAVIIHTAMEWEMPNSISKKGRSGTGKARAADVKNVARVIVNRAVPLLDILATPSEIRHFTIDGHLKAWR